MAVGVVAAEVIYWRAVVTLVRNKTVGRWAKVIAVAVLVSDVVRLVGWSVWLCGAMMSHGNQMFLLCGWHNVLSFLVFTPVFVPLMYLAATCMLPFSVYGILVLFTAPAMMASVVRARMLFSPSPRSWMKIVLVFLVTYWPEVFPFLILGAQ